MTDQPIDTREMLAIHDTLRKEFASLPLRVKGTPVGETERAGIVGGHVILMLDILQVHHEGEDAVLWPLLEERAPDDIDEVERLKGQHVAMEETMVRARAQASAWMADPSIDNRSGLHTTLIALERELLDHLSHEETEILPVVAVTLTAEEFASLGAHSRAGLTQEQLTLALGMIVDDTSAELSGLILDAMPPEARAGFEQFGLPAYRAYRERLVAAG